MAKNGSIEKLKGNPKRFFLLLGLLFLLAFSAKGIFKENVGIGEGGYRSEESGILYDYTLTSFEAALSSGKPTILDFSADWCPPCRITAPILEKLRDDYKGRINILTANADYERDLVLRYKAEWYPTFIFFNSDGEETLRIQGLIFEPDFKVGIEDMLSGQQESLAIEKISSGEVLRRMMEGDSMILLDVRTAEEYASGHIPSAISLPLSEIQTGHSALGLNKEGEIIVYCQGGVSSKSAARMLYLMGYKNVKDMGGILDWSLINGPIVN